MKQSFLFTISCALFFACNQPVTTASDNDSPLVNKEQADSSLLQQTACYGFTSATDTVLVELQQVGEMVTGTMYIHYSGKDKNNGTLKGKMSGDTLYADYTFQSEGTTSVREVAFLQTANQLMEGFGEVKEQGGKMVFQQRSTLGFDQSMKLMKRGCN